MTQTCRSLAGPKVSQTWFTALSIMAVLLVSTISSFSVSTEAQRPSYACPSENKSTASPPCFCTDKHRGLDISCEKVSLPGVNATLVQLRQSKPNIYYLKLRYMGLPSVADGFFEGLSIKHLTVIYVNLSSIGEEAFAGLDEHLESLDLSQNRLKTVPHRAMRNLRNLIHLNLNHNNITFVHAGALDGLDSLLQVTFYGNGITRLDENALGGASRSLIRINLGKNLFESFPIQALKTLNNLEGLEIQENSIDRIDRGDFSGLQRLDNINLASNQISELRPETFKHLDALNSLDLGSNRIATIDKDAFLGVEDTLEWLMLGENRLNSFPSHALKKLKKLRQLDLHSNSLTSIPDDAFEDFGGQLKSIGLHNNSISHIPSNAFYNLHLLQWLHLNENKLQRIPQEIFEPVFDTLTTLNVYDNPLVCDCELRWFREWANNQGRKVLRMMEKTQCREPQGFRGRAIHDLPIAYMTCPMTKGRSSASTSAATIVRPSFSSYYTFISVPFFLVRESAAWCTLSLFNLF